jgi:hypothetical protein
MSESRDREIVRRLMERYMEAAAEPVQEERRVLWRRHNGLKPTRALIHLRGGVCWDEVREVTALECEDAFWRGHERGLRQALWTHEAGDDAILEPWWTQRASFKVVGWGMRGERRHSETAGGSWKEEAPLKELGDRSGLTEPHHVIDEDETARNVERLGETVGDLIEVNVERSPVYVVWQGDIATELGHLRGIEQFMWDMMDDPAGLKGLVQWMSDGILRTHEEAEAAGDWSLTSGQNQSMTYAEELPDPRPNSGPAGRKDLWVYMAAQEFTLVSPAMHEEFLLRYQMPIMAPFGLSAYGCCEDLTEKIDMLRQVPNLRRIAVTPRADLARCAEQIGTDYVISWRPNPAEMVCCGWDGSRVRRVIREGLSVCDGLHVDITLKDVQTVEREPERLRDWVRIAREEAERAGVSP